MSPGTEIAAVGRALPEHRYAQEEITAELLAILDPPQRIRAHIESLHANVRVRHRHLALPLEEYAGLATFGQANDAWIRVAQDLGQRALAEALARAGLAPADVDAIFSVSVTGIANPSLDARLVNRVGLRRDVKRTPIFGLGCVAGVAGIARAADYLEGHPDDVAVLLSVELCSLTLQQHDLSLANLISNGLFGDGAAAVVLLGARRAQALRLGGPPPGPPPGPSVRATRSSFYPDTEDVMGWTISERGFEVVLSKSVPVIARELLGGDVRAFLADHGLDQRAIRHWVCHPGGPKVLEAMQESLELDDAAVALSWKVLAEQGNCSSASVLMVLGELFDGPRPAPGELGCLVAMGPGFCSEMVLVEW
jgi:alkylresorcinol/alkylpyrone synthase